MLTWLISHISEDDEINVYPPWAGGLVSKELRKTPNHPDTVIKGFIKFTGLPESKSGKNSHLKIFDVLFKAVDTACQFNYRGQHCRVHSYNGRCIIDSSLCREPVARRASAIFIISWSSRSVLCNSSTVVSFLFFNFIFSTDVSLCLYDHFP